MGETMRQMAIFWLRLMSWPTTVPPGGFRLSHIKTFRHACHNGLMIVAYVGLGVYHQGEICHDVR